MSGLSQLSRFPSSPSCEFSEIWPLVFSAMWGMHLSLFLSHARGWNTNNHNVFKYHNYLHTAMVSPGGDMLALSTHTPQHRSGRAHTFGVTDHSAKSIDFVRFRGLSTRDPTHPLVRSSARSLYTPASTDAERAKPGWRGCSRVQGSRAQGCDVVAM